MSGHFRTLCIKGLELRYKVIIIFFQLLFLEFIAAFLLSPIYLMLVKTDIQIPLNHEE